MAKQAGAGRTPNMDDVAKAVGVSKTTISRYLHGQYHYMSEQTRQRIAKVIQEMGYRPNKMAQSLKATNSFMIGVTLADVGNPFSSQMLKGIQQICDQRGVQVMACDCNNSAKREQTNIESLLDAQVDGLIINTVGSNEEYLREYQANQSHRPMVLLDRTVDDLDCDGVTTNNRVACEEMLDHVISRGYDRVIYVTRAGLGIKPRYIRAEVVKGYIAKGAVDGGVLVYHDQGELGQLLRRQLDAGVNDKVCVFANNEECMRDVLTVLEHEPHGRLGLCVFADRQWARFISGGITCQDQDGVEMGAQAARMLVTRVYDGYDGPCRLVEVPATLHIYDSTRSV